MKMNVSQEPFKSDDIFTVKKTHKNYSVTVEMFCFSFTILIINYRNSYTATESCTNKIQDNHTIRIALMAIFIFLKGFFFILIYRETNFCCHPSNEKRE